jgi:hypothetical protein
VTHALRLRWIATVQADLRILESSLANEANPVAQYHAHAALKHLGLLYASLTILDDEPAPDTHRETPSAISSAPPPRMQPGESGRIEV